MTISLLSVRSTPLCNQITSSSGTTFSGLLATQVNKNLPNGRESGQVVSNPRKLFGITVKLLISGSGDREVKIHLT